MAIIYYLDFPCPVKEEVSPGRMLRLLYGQEHANEALNRARKQDPSVKPADVRVDLTLRDSNGRPRLVAGSVAEVQEQAAPLEKLAGHCIGCRANVTGQSFGCRGRVDFPISRRAEVLLMSRVRHSGGDPTATMLANYFENNGIKGNRASEMRSLAGIFFESGKSLARRLTDGRKVSSNQLFEMFFQHGSISPKHARFLLGMLDLVDFELPVEQPLNQLPNLYVVEREDAGMVVQRTGLRLTALEKDRCTRQLQSFFGALLLASELGHEVWVKT